ncbi:flagellar basal-body MS-ring/collar protein FliF [Sphingomonas hengshuiensis]|uniref:Flagellar M-ring protein n=1 Tax=Sphingomonas hengshuiensis TaxID=1609977 RepID=A0A7U4JB01_9SPHN|nr:flagellar basal-body MS-ring/collar protein FliF [Sphingomonas hengshuiensis]AJP73510.1 flagellar M-ring protein FliF [Sphingomonas hengshuiensis]
MSTSLTPAPPSLPAADRLAAPLQQVRGLLAQPAVRRAMPLLLLIGVIAAGLLAWSMVATSPQRILFANVSDADKAAISSALEGASIASAIDASGSITVAEDDYHKARMLLAAQDLPKAHPGGYQILDQLPMGVSRAVEGERLRQARETELARSIEEIDSVAEARVHLATPEASAFVRDRAAPSASVILKLQPGRVLGDAQVRSIVNLVASSVPGMQPESVTIVDQMGALLSKSGAGGTSAGDTRIDFQRRVEDKYRTQLNQLLTPLVGQGNFTAEVQADVDLDENQATRESYDKEGAVVRAEQGAWTGSSKDGAAPGGIPGALSNTPPPASTMVAPNQQPQPGATPAPGAAAVPAAPAGPQQKQTDSFTRTYETGKQVSVTRAMPGGVKRLSVAVLLREEPGKPRGAVEIAQITQLVRAAVGYDGNRADQVTVVSRKFSPSPAAELLDQRPWYDASWVALAARNGTALVIALLVLLLGVRPLAKGLMKKREEPASDRLALAIGGPAGPAVSQEEGAPFAPPANVSIDMLEARGNSYDERVGLVRGFTRDNPARAALAVRDMIKADAP